MATTKKAASPAPRGPEDDIEARRQRVVDMYNEGYKLAEIAAETGFPRGTLYWVLRRAGIKPDRYGAPEDEQQVITAAELLQQLLAAQRELAITKDKLERVQIALDQAYDRMEGRKPAAKATKAAVKAAPARPSTRP